MADLQIEGELKKLQPAPGLFSTYLGSPGPSVGTFLGKVEACLLPVH